MKRTVKGGAVGIILDARGRPLALPDEDAARREAVRRTIDAIQLYPEEETAPQGA